MGRYHTGMDATPLHVSSVVFFSLGATVVAHAWGMHKRRMPILPIVLCLHGCMGFMWVTKDYPIDTFRALLKYVFVSTSGAL